MLRVILVLICALAPIASAATVGETDRFVPLVQAGEGWTTQITVMNLSGEPAYIVAAFARTGGEWNVELKAPRGKVLGPNVEAFLEPGGTLLIETAGMPDQVARGFADITELGDKPIGVITKLLRRVDGKVVESFLVPYLPGLESRSVMALDLTDKDLAAELVWVSPTYSTTLDLTFRDEKGMVVLEDQFRTDAKPQVFVDPLKEWPKLDGFKGTVEWKVTFPAADRYEYRFLTGVSVLRREGKVIGLAPALTLRSDQKTSNPY